MTTLSQKQQTLVFEKHLVQQKEMYWRYSQNCLTIFWISYQSQPQSLLLPKRTFRNSVQKSNISEFCLFFRIFPWPGSFEQFLEVYISFTLILRKVHWLKLARDIFLLISQKITTLSEEKTNTGFWEATEKTAMTLFAELLNIRFNQLPISIRLYYYQN